MTVSTTGLRISYSGNGVTTAFAFPFRFLANSDLQVILIQADGTEVPQVLNTNYTVAGAGVESGGTVTMLVPPAAGEKLFIRRQLALTQEIDYITGDRFPAETHEEALDRLTMIAQQVDEEVARAVKLPPTSEDDPDDLVASLFAARDSAEADAAQTAADRVQTAADRVQTAADRVQTGLDRVATGQDRAAVAADLVQTGLDAVATAADRVQTGLDRIAVAADLVQTDLDTIATAADRVQTGLDAIATAADRVQTGLDRVQTGEDRVATGEDRADINEKYLGSFADNPVGTVVGQLYFNTTSGELRVWSGSVWLAPTTSQSFVYRGYFKKTDSTTPAFTKTGAFTVSTSQQLYVEVDGLILSIASSTVVTMPSPTVGRDYAIWVHPDGTLQATADFVTPPVANARKIGGFHYAPGGNAAAQAGGDSVAQINEYSLYDLNYRPATSDPRGMTCVAGSFWSDIYLLNTNPDANGTSAYDRTIADGSSPPIIPAALGGNGTTDYGGLSWFEAASIAAAMGKKMFGQAEFMAAAFGVTEATARGTDPVTTRLDAPRTSKWGLMQATGNLWTWAADRGVRFTAASWNANTEGFGSEYNAPNASLLGAYWTDGVNAGSRSSYWLNPASISSQSIGLRLRCDHYQAD